MAASYAWLLIVVPYFIYANVRILWHRAVWLKKLRDDSENPREQEDTDHG